jgi:hypothetical protein
MNKQKNKPVTHGRRRIGRRARSCAAACAADSFSIGGYNFSCKTDCLEPIHVAQPCRIEYDGFGGTLPDVFGALSCASKITSMYRQLAPAAVLAHRCRARARACFCACVPCVRRRRTALDAYNGNRISGTLPASLSALTALLVLCAIASLVALVRCVLFVCLCVCVCACFSVSAVARGDYAAYLCLHACVRACVCTSCTGVAVRVSGCLQYVHASPCVHRQLARLRAIIINRISGTLPASLSALTALQDLCAPAHVGTRSRDAICL